MTASAAASTFSEAHNTLQDSTRVGGDSYTELIRTISTDRFEGSVLERAKASTGSVQQTVGALTSDRCTESSATPIDLTTLFPERLRQIQRAQKSFAVLQEWEGYVVAVTKENFTARLLDITTGRRTEDEEAEFPLEELSDADRQHVRVGSVFRWTVGHRRLPSGTKERVSLIVFRRLPAWTRRELEQNSHQAEAIANILGGE